MAYAGGDNEPGPAAQIAVTPALPGSFSLAFRSPQLAARQTRACTNAENAFADGTFFKNFEYQLVTYQEPDAHGRNGRGWYAAPIPKSGLTLKQRRALAVQMATELQFIMLATEALLNIDQRPMVRRTQNDDGSLRWQYWDPAWQFWTSVPPPSFWYFEYDRCGYDWVAMRVLPHHFASCRFRRRLSRPIQEYFFPLVPSALTISHNAPVLRETTDGTTYLIIHIPTNELNPAEILVNTCYFSAALADMLNGRLGMVFEPGMPIFKDHGDGGAVAFFRLPQGIPADARKRELVIGWATQLRIRLWAGLVWKYEDRAP